MAEQKKDSGNNRFGMANDKLARGMLNLSMDMERAVDADEHVDSFRMRGPRWADDDYMMVAKRTASDGTPEVAFHGGPSLEATLVGFGNRLRNGQLKWVTDKYAADIAEAAVKQ